VDPSLWMLMGSMFSLEMSALETSVGWRDNTECTEMSHSSGHGLIPMSRIMEGPSTALLSCTGLGHGSIIGLNFGLILFKKKNISKTYLKQYRENL